MLSGQKHWKENVILDYSRFPASILIPVDFYIYTITIQQMNKQTQYLMVSDHRRLRMSVAPYVLRIIRFTDLLDLFF